MKYDMVQFERGQVWMIRYKRPEAVGNEQAKDRPWLVLSIGKFNHSSGMITCVPLTSRSETRTPAQVAITNVNGRDNVILCEQIRSFDTKSGNYIFDFMGNLSDSVLEKVDVAVSIHLGMHYSPITLNKLYDSMEAIIKSVGHMQDKASTPKFTDEDVSKFADKLKMLTISTEQGEHKVLFDKDQISVLTSAHDEVSSTLEPYNPLPDNRQYTSYSVNPVPEYNPMIVYESTEEDTSEGAPEKKSKRTRWTPERCKEFLDDAMNLPMREVMEKWNISKKQTYYVTKNYVAGLLKKNQ